MPDIKEEVNGRWTAIFSQLGIDVGDGRHKECPICGVPGRHKPFRYDDIDGTGTWFCTYCGAGDGWALLMKKFNIQFNDAVAEVRRVIGKCEKGAIRKEMRASPEALRNLFVNSKPIHDGDVASFYLQCRGLTLLPKVLRYSRVCYEPETRQKHHALLAIFQAHDGQAITMLRTYLDIGGSKLNIEEPKKLMPSLRKMSGGAVRLFEYKEVLGVSTGLETSIAASEIFGVPVWATLNDSNLESFVVPGGVKELWIFGDNDKNFSGQSSAYSLAHRVVIDAAKKKIDMQVNVRIPVSTGDDWLDVLNKTKKK